MSPSGVNMIQSIASHRTCSCYFKSNNRSKGSMSYFYCLCFYYCFCYFSRCSFAILIEWGSQSYRAL